MWAKHSEIQQANLKALADGDAVKDGERLPLAIKHMGACEIYPQTIAHNPNGRLVVVCGDGESVFFLLLPAEFFLLLLLLPSCCCRCYGRLVSLFSSTIPGSYQSKMIELLLDFTSSFKFILVFTFLQIFTSSFKFLLVSTSFFLVFFKVFTSFVSF